jgi:hypothetical protein
MKRIEKIVFLNVFEFRDNTLEVLLDKNLDIVWRSQLWLQKQSVEHCPSLLFHNLSVAMIQKLLEWQIFSVPLKNLPCEVVRVHCGLRLASPAFCWRSF